MAFGTASKIFRPHIANLWKAGAGAFDAGTVKAALYGDTGTPLSDTTLALSGYNAVGSPWVTANEKSSSTAWPAGGQTLGSKVVNEAGAGVVFLDAADAASGATANMSDIRGCLVYNDTVTNKYGLCFNSFGGAQAVSGGTFTIVWSAQGIARITIS